MNGLYVRNYELRFNIRINTKRPLNSRTVRLDSGYFQIKVHQNRKWCLTWVLCAVKSPFLHCKLTPLGPQSRFGGQTTYN